MMHNKKLLLGIAAGVVVLFLLARRSASAGSTGIAQQAAAVDPNQSAAQALTDAAKQADAARQQALANLDFQQAANLKVVDYAKQLGANKLVACPNGGVVRATPDGSGGLTVGCVQKTHGPSWFEKALGIAAQIIK
jgi:hypothetical protein